MFSAECDDLFINWLIKRLVEVDTIGSIFMNTCCEYFDRLFHRWLFRLLIEMGTLRSMVGG